jgi:hypothetical protein
MRKITLTTERLGGFFLQLALVFGAWFRISTPLDAGFPINDGGLFYLMIQALRDNLYRLPEHIQYNGLNIPFAYPPFAFYVAGVLTDIFHTSIIKIMLYLPGIVLIFTIPAVYYLANLILKSEFQAGLASLIYSVIPGSMTWLIMGGGVTRSFGQLFLLMASINIYLLYTKGRPKDIIYSILFSAMVCITHPEAALHTVAIAFLFWLFYGMNKKGLVESLVVAAGTLIMTSPWWVVMLQRFGTSPFIAASQTGSNNLAFLVVPFTSFSGEYFLPIIAVFAIVGIVERIARQEYMLIAFYFVPFFIEPRNGANVITIPIALLAAVGLSEVILPSLAKIESAVRKIEFSQPIQSRTEKLFLSFSGVCLLLGMLFSGFKFATERVSPEVMSAFEWIRTNTSQDGRFLILTGEDHAFRDYVNEWFPALTNRLSITTVQGKEWLEPGLFEKEMANNRSIQKCAINSNILPCVEAVTTKLDLDYGYVIIITNPSDVNPARNSVIIAKHSYKVMLSSNEVVVLEKLLDDE